ncbi:alpha-hydroxy acid oxidase [Campylobacter pinnipediorum]|uniref:Alpha-hydroxy-acid oxidizing enzyme n=1 Tax=Campylobacter pinnipediorum subsp. pinnipediorum TaxID=1660067 RepID=A0AAX0LA26_9BACT|nr:alpha-hydroxy acid oxidase [Campylobacter pinnipediorum]AQW82977.1 flavin-containing NAD-independent L-lactate dehydrogenase [Campylobacter pinnipediorum subsp. pinnipediorum]OPA77317.1 alpha-hydroxy-acid oxidizing enzyme [Campylobacter pinnipediorum subsp. pinnipediorum]OPA78244.1 alpha-hydroxy-acid oxidizing enzyme [Campylobacter pinnipediorum subsp. pinnipediorum]
MGRPQKPFHIDVRYPSVEHLRIKAKKRMPRFAYDYLTEGCNDDLNVTKNTSEIREIEMVSRYLTDFRDSDPQVELFGETYDAPFGISAVGLQSLMWPKTPQYLAKAAKEHNIPFMLSTVTTMSIEEAAKITDGKFWFQLYYPKDKERREDILKRAWDNGCKVLCLLSDVPTFGYRPKDVYNGLGMPPAMYIRNILNAMTKPTWAFETLLNGGMPRFETLEKYMTEKMNLQQLGMFMDDFFDGKLTVDRIKDIQDIWPGKIVIKGISTVEDTQTAIDLGVDGIIVSNHGGRQLDAGPTSIKTLPDIVKVGKGKIKIMIDSGMRTGPDIARVIASGAEFCFLGRPFMYGTGALGSKGGDQVAQILKREFIQVMQQLNCPKVEDLPNFLYKK